MAPTPKDSGMGTSYEVPYVNSLVIVSFLSIAMYNVLELTILVQTFFKRHSGVYYYALLVANWGIFFHGLETLLKFFKLNDGMPGHKIANTVVGWTGWVMMVTGQSIVLWSRLHLVQIPWSRNILAIIISNAVVLHISTGVLTFLTNISHDPDRYKTPYSIIERIQVTIFFLQEVFLSSLYIWRTTVILRSEGPLFDTNTDRHVRGSKGRKVLLHTIAMGSIIIALDITLLVLEFCGLYDIQTSYKDAVYSVKLKMEFSILNQLIALVRNRLAPQPASYYPTAKPNRFRRATDGDRGSTLRSANRSPPTSTPGYKAGAYARMDEGGKRIELKKLNSTDVLKTTTTEVRIDRIDRVLDDVERESREHSAASSEVYIIENNKP